MNPADMFSHEPHPVHLGAGEVLFHMGDPADGMYVLLEGTVDIVIGGHVVENSTRGSIIGEMALIDQSRRGATVVARTDASLAKIDEARFRRIIQQNPFFATHVMKVLANRIRHMDTLLVQHRPH
jgi:CRP-like cAMP-binding protein